jgi:hypothetical protein
MSLSVLEATVRILGAEPSQHLDMKLWQEIVQLRVALKNLASLVDARLAAMADSGSNTYRTDGYFEHKVYFGLFTTVKLEAADTIAVVSGKPIFIRASGGKLKASLAYDNVCEGITVGAATGNVHDIMLRGLVLLEYGGLQNINYTTPRPQCRLSTIKIRDPDNRWSSYTLRGHYTWYSNEHTEQYGYYYITGLRYAGHILGNFVASSDTYFKLTGKGGFAYFNPRQV